MSLGNEIKRLRKIKGFTIHQLAARAKLTPHQLESLEERDHEVAREKLLKIADHLGIPGTQLTKLLPDKTDSSQGWDEGGGSSDDSDPGEGPAESTQQQISNPPGFTVVRTTVHGANAIVLQVNGSVAANIGFQEGDRLVFRQSSSANHDDVVIVSIDESTAVKIYRKGKDKKTTHMLHPVNGDGNPLEMDEDCRIIAVMKARIREGQAEKPEASSAPVK